MKITGRELLEIVQKLIKEEDVFEIRNDFYWNIPSEDLYVMERDPKEFTVGQLSDDLEELREMLAGEDDPILFHDLEHLSPIIRAIAIADRA